MTKTFVNGKLVSDDSIAAPTYSTAGFRIDEETGLPIIRVMKALRPAVYDSKDMAKAFEIGKAAHEQVERKFNGGTEKEYVVHINRGDYILEAHLDMYNPKQSLVLEIKSWSYFVTEHHACILQLSAYAAMVNAESAFFVLYQGEFVNKVVGGKTKEEFRVKSMSQAYVPLMPKGEIMELIDAKAHELMAEMRANGKLV